MKMEAYVDERGACSIRLYMHRRAGDALNSGGIQWIHLPQRKSNVPAVSGFMGWNAGSDG